MKKKILLILNTYDFMSAGLRRNSSIEKKYKIFNKLDKSWANFFYNNLKKDYKLKKIYPFLDKKFLRDEQILRKMGHDLKFNPNYIFNTTNNSNIHSYIKKFKNTKKMIWLSHNVSESDLRYLKSVYDCLITYNDNLITIARKINFKYYKLMISSPKVFKTNFKNFKKRSNKIYFTGSLGNNFTARLRYLIFLYENFDLKLRLRNTIEKYKILNLLNSILIKIFPKIIDHLYNKKVLPFTNKLKYVNENEIFGKELIKELQKFKFCININSDFDKDKNINSRVFEALSCGCLLFTDKNKCMESVFKNEKHVIYFKSKEDLKNKINYYKKNIKKAFKISQRGNSIFNKKYHSKARLKEFKKILIKEGI
ncbi:MAG: hypothetical protein CBD95_006065 [Flavobacteriales bacterium TMED235]|nr:MAG: hypothetical protein CBD95_006065 [Flavobacteriales bacterium TMED235]|tara:strand:- start:12331 stop:13431 length:1101 start_codon:yes stop_codon:yes gene_type:complete